VRGRFAGIDPRDLQSVTEVKQMQRKRGGARDRQGMAALYRPEPRAKKALTEFGNPNGAFVDRDL